VKKFTRLDFDKLNAVIEAAEASPQDGHKAALDFLKSLQHCPAFLTDQQRAWLIDSMAEEEYICNFDHQLTDDEAFNIILNGDIGLRNMDDFELLECFGESCLGESYSEGEGEDPIGETLSALYLSKKAEG